MHFHSFLLDDALGAGGCPTVVGLGRGLWVGKPEAVGITCATPLPWGAGSRAAPATTLTPDLIPRGVYPPGSGPHSPASFSSVLFTAFHDVSVVWMHLHV